MKQIKLLSLGLLVGLLTSVVFLGGCIPAGTEEGSTSIWTMLGGMVLLFGLMYFVMIRPQRKKQQEHQQHPH